MTRWWRAAAVPAAFGAAAVVLWFAGRGELAAPPLDPAAWGAWVEARGAATAAVALGRLAALGVATWLAVASALQIGGSCAPNRCIAAANSLRGRWLLPPSPVRRAIAALAGAGVASVVAVAGAGAARGDGAEGTATMRVLPDDPADAPASAPEPAAAPAPAPAPATWTVAAGESFWSIAEEVVSEALGRPATEGEVVPYWVRLIEANRHRLASANPDLIHPGQVFVLPAPA